MLRGKNAPIQLQTEIKTDKELDEFLMKDGIIVLDVHPGWTGNCDAMLPHLKKLKLEMGEILSLAECNADTVIKLNRFSRRSEPTFLICSEQKVVRTVFGANVPNLKSAILAEIEIYKLHKEGKCERTFYDIDLPSPAEVERDAEKTALREKQERIAREKARKELHDKLEVLIADILKTVDDLWVTIFLPHTVPHYNRIIDPARNLGMVYKDRVLVKVTADMIPVLTYRINNPLEDIVLEYMLGKEILAVLWVKNRYVDKRAVNEAAYDLNRLILGLPMDEKDDASLENKDEISIKTHDNVSLSSKASKKSKESKKEVPEFEEEEEEGLQPLIVYLGAEEPEKEEEVIDLQTKIQGSRVSFVEDQDISKFRGSDGEIDVARMEIEGANLNKVNPFEVKDEPAIVPETDDEKISITVPPIWIPLNKEANALFLYLFFKKSLKNLPQEKEEEPDHNLVAFPATRYEEVTEFCKDFENDILASGFFSSDDPENYKLICKTKQKYDTLDAGPKDMFLLKVSHKTSHALLDLSMLNPDHVSMNVREGKAECEKIFNTKFIEHEDEIIEEEFKEELIKKPRRRTSIVRQSQRSPMPETRSSKPKLINENSIETIVNSIHLDDP